ncbi:hypothetical protein [Sodalinema gerasimenkoae]|uniref:hypothetical protein n=1 Tax=Sodalinema gerasimenkoae TaxID=2862348 RepID=UPI00135BC495|nr:hypothetical protein [Sodalinema gerasimenkoae]
MRQPLQRRKSWFPWRDILLQVGLAAVWAGAFGSITGGVWLGAKLIIDPDSARWLSDNLPDWTQLGFQSSNRPETLSDIRDRIEDSGYTPAEPIEIPGASVEPDLLLPVLQQRSEPCGKQCFEIVALQIYQRVSPGWNPEESSLFYLTAEISVTGPAESYAIAPLVNARSLAPGSTRPLPLTHLQALTENAPADGLWFNLIGERDTGEGGLSYGQVYHYNPSRYSLSLMLQWTSPAGQLPQWEEFTGRGRPEFVVDRTVGLEPDFGIYQLRSRNFLPNPVQLVPLSLNEPALDSRTYQNALLLARNGLWSEAESILRSLKQERGSQWTSEAQSQLDKIAFHAEIVSAQADASWASPSQKLLTALLDGRWSESTTILDGLGENEMSDVISMLSSDTHRLWRRIEAMVRVNPTNQEAMFWGVIVRSLDRGQAEAMTWLAEQENVSETTLEEAEQVLNRIATN